jgi:hypothetical protein
MYRILMGETSWKTVTWNTGRWDDNIKMHLMEVGNVNGGLMEFVHDHIQWQALVVTV